MIYMFNKNFYCIFFCVNTANMDTPTLPLLLGSRYEIKDMKLSASGPNGQVRSHR